jgi:hypothetical protein
MANPYIGYRCPQDVHDALIKHLADIQQEKTEFLVDLIRKELCMGKKATLSDRVRDLEQKVLEIERTLLS